MADGYLRFALCYNSAMSTLFSSETRLRLAWFCVGAHLVSILALLLVIQHGTPAGDLSVRREYVATHALAWGMAWGVWVFASLSLILFWLACLEVLPHKTWGMLAVGLTCLGALVDWVNEAIWIFLAPTWALLARSDAFYVNLYAVWDRAYTVLSVGVAHGLYTVSGIIITAIALQTPRFPRWLSRWGIGVWSLSLVMAYAGFAGEELWLLVVPAILFPLFMAWVALMGYGWLCAARPHAIDEALRERLTFRETVRAMIPKHPVPMETIFCPCILVNFAVKPDVVRRLLPEPFEPDVHGGKAFVSIVTTQMVDMRPAFLPRVFGITYNQFVYRTVVRYQNEVGFYYLRSDADNWLYNLAGDWLTFFRFNLSPLMFRYERNLWHLDITPKPAHHADIHASYDLHTATRDMPASSQFKTLAEAKDFLVELFVAFGYDSLREKVGRVTVKRGKWDIQIVTDTRAQYDWLNGSTFFPAGCAQLDSIFYVEEIPYYWYRMK
jgi:uncharacterized protein YqjF (DUF2071 family)